jgi:hypothetical protein
MNEHDHLFKDIIKNQQELLSTIESLLTMPEYDGTTSTSIDRRARKHAARKLLRSGRQHLTTLSQGVREQN